MSKKIPALKLVTIGGVARASSFAGVGEIIQCTLSVGILAPSLYPSLARAITDCPMLLLSFSFCIPIALVGMVGSGSSLHYLGDGGGTHNLGVPDTTNHEMVQS